MVIDVHGHVTHPELLRRLPMPPALGDIEGMIEKKAAAGIDLTIVGSPVGFGTMVPVEGHDNYDQPLDKLRSFHDWLSETVAAHPDSLRAYAYVNPFGDDEELEHVAELGRRNEFVGLIVNSSVRGEYLDSDRAGPFFELAAELEVPIFIHPPAEPVGTASTRDFRLLTHVSRFCDVTACLAALCFSELPIRYPNLAFVAAMAGGAIGLLSERLELAAGERVPGPAGERKGASPDPAAFLDRTYLDTATPSAAAMSANLDLVGAERMLFGSDSPPTTTPIERALAMVRELPVPERERDRVLGGNAAELFGINGVC